MSEAPERKPLVTPEMLRIQAEVAATRAQLAASVDALTDAVKPQALAQAGADAARRVVSDATSPDADPQRRTRARIILGATVAAVALLAAVVVGRSRH